MPETDLSLIKKHSVKGVVALTSRNFLLQIINFAANFLLTIFLVPEIFGIYAIVTAAVNFLNYFSDIGLAAALIQKRGKITEADLKTTFTIQQVLVFFLVAAAFLSTNFVARFYKLSPEGAWLFRALVVSFFLSSLKTIPSIILERKLAFNRLIIPQIAETVIFNLVAVTLAWQGRGVVSFTWAVLARGIIGLILIYLISPWRPGFSFNNQSARKLLSFGIPFQLNSLLALIKDDLLTLFLGKILPFAQVGLISWAQKWANMPLRFVMDNVTKVTFPAYSRLQYNLPALKEGIEKALFVVCFLTFPMLVGFGLLAPSLVQIIPDYLKWQPALLSLWFFSLQAAFSCVSTTLTNTLNATGRIKTTLNLMLLWTALTWFFTPLFIYFWGFNGVAPAFVIVALTVILPIKLVKKITPFSITENVGKPLLGAVIMGFCLSLLIPLLVNNLPTIILVIILSAIIYSSTMLLLAREKIAEAFQLISNSFKHE